MSKTQNTTDAPAKRSRFSDFARGFKAPWGAISYALKHPGLLKFALPPIPIVGGLLTGLFYLTFTYSADLLTWAWAEPTGAAWYHTWLLIPLWHVTWFLTLAMTTALGVIGVIVASIPLAGPFMEMLSEKVEAIETGFEAPFSFSVMMRNVGLSLVHALLLVTVGLVVAVFSLGLSLIPILGPILSFIISMTVVPMLVGFNPFDYPMTIRLWSFHNKFKFVWDNLALIYGFSLCAYLMLYVPFLNLFLLPMCVIAATRMLIDLQAEGRANFRDRRQEALVARGKLSADILADDPLASPPKETAVAQVDAPETAKVQA